MSQSNGQNLQVTDDDEQLVDKTIKKQILTLRKVVDDDERRLYVDRVRAEPEYRRVDANMDWGISVRQYLRGIKRLWADHEDVPIKNVEQYWTQMPLAQNEYLVPPDANGFKFSLVEARDQFTSDRQLRHAIGIGPNGDIPDPYEVSFQGLQSVLSRNRIEHSWTITTHRQGPPPEHNVETVSRSAPLPKHILENAVEAADNFLQQAGLGFDVAMPDYYGGEVPGI